MGGFAPPTLKHKTYINMDSSNWQQGGVTTVVTPSAAPPPSFELLQPSNQEEEKKVNRGGGRKPRDEEGEEQVGGGAMPQEESRPDGEPAGRGEPVGGLLQTPTVSTPSCGSQQRTNRSTVLQ